MKLSEKDLERFWSRIEKTPGGCWGWIYPGTKGVCGLSKFYGRRAGFGVGRKRHNAARIMWELSFGPIPDGLFVCHKCDNPDCVKPEHLFLGTNSDNAKDAVAKGRWGAGRPQPSYRKQVQARLARTREQTNRVGLLSPLPIRILNELDKGKLSQSDIARKIGVTRQRVSQVALWRKAAIAEERAQATEAR